MCGITGFTGDPDKKTLKRMTDLLSYRGPDDSGTYVSDNVCLGHRRLSIIDLSGGKQPMTNEDGSIVASFNGEIYNYKKLMTELEGMGHRFRTSSDTEVLVHAFEEWGLDFPDKLRGMYAFAIWEETSKTLHLGRDHVGIKPLYYARLGCNVVFASEPKAILAHPKLKMQVDPQALHLVANTLYLPEDRTMFLGIRKVMPGTIMSFTEDGVESHQFWRLSTDTDYGVTESQVVKKIRALLEESIEAHMVADVPVGSMLSGGLDSTAMVALAQRHTDEPLKTFSICFGDSSEEDEARMVSDMYETEHSQLVVSEDDAASILPAAIWHFDMPNLCYVTIYFGSMAAREKVKTCLHGSGNDEVMSGYIYTDNRLLNVDRFSRMPGILKTPVAASARILERIQSKTGPVELDKLRHHLEIAANGFEGLENYAQHNMNFYERDYPELYGEKIIQSPPKDLRQVYRKYYSQGTDFLNRVYYIRFYTRMLNEYVIADDAMSMANSLEYRVPFLDREYIEYCYGVPYHLKTRGGTQGKYAYKKAVKDLLPRKVLEMRKAGAPTIRGPGPEKRLFEIAREILPDGKLVRDGYFKKPYLEKMISGFDKKGASRLRLGTLMLSSCELWYRIYTEGDPLKPELKLENLAGL